MSQMFDGCEVFNYCLWDYSLDISSNSPVPSKPRITHISNHQATSFYVNWEPPREINGRLIKYELQWIHNEDVKSRGIGGHLISTMTAYVSDLSMPLHSLELASE